MVRTNEIVTKLCAQVMRYLLTKSADHIDISYDSRDDNQTCLIKIGARVVLSESDLKTLSFYLNIGSHEELAYMYLPLMGEYGSDEEMLLFATLFDNADIVYDKSKAWLNLSFSLKCRGVLKR